MSKIQVTTLGANQTEVICNGVKTLFSYNTPVACFVRLRVYRTSKKHSVTTSKHIKLWFTLYNVNFKEVIDVSQEMIEAIASGEQFNEI